MKRTAYYLAASLCLISLSLSAAGQDPALRVKVRRPSERSVFRVGERNYGATDRYNPGDESERYSYRAAECLAADLDGDSELEFILRWEPSNARSIESKGLCGNTLIDAYKADGTLMWRLDLGHNIRSTKEGPALVVEDLDGDGKAELVCRSADGTVDGTGRVLGNPRADWRSMDEASATYSRIVVGPEFISVFEGSSGKELASSKLLPLRYPLDSWGGIGGSDPNGVNSDRFTACAATLQDKGKAAVFVRGGRARTAASAWSWDGKELKMLWLFDSSLKGSGKAAASGSTMVLACDVDGDGKDEICLGSAVLDQDGSPLSASGLLYGDYFQVSDLDPKRKGLEVFGSHEATSALALWKGECAMAMYDPLSGKVLWKAGEGEKVSMVLAADIDPRHKGAECWVADAVAIQTPAAPGRGPARPSAPVKKDYDGPLKGIRRAADGKLISLSQPSACLGVLNWDDDPLAELLGEDSILKWDYEAEKTIVLLKAEGVMKKPLLCADILGGAGDEVVWISEDQGELLVFSGAGGEAGGKPSAKAQPRR